MQPVDAPDGPPATGLEVTGRLGREALGQVRALIDAVAAADGVPPLSEHVTLHLRYGGEGPDHNLLLREPGGHEPVGYAHVDTTDAVEGAVAELAVHPGHRRRGHGRALVEAALQLAAEAGDGRLRLWAHGDHPDARALAAGMGFARTRQLFQMRRPLTAGPGPAQLPDGVRVRSFAPDQDEDAWLRLNARAFAQHPEQGAWTRQDLDARMRESWFDPAGFLVAEDLRADPRQPPMVAFHWTKVHGGQDQVDGHGHDPIGEVYVVGVDPDQQGRGLGRSMTLAGLHWLREQGLDQAMLYVDNDNPAAMRLYRSIGFEVHDTDVVFQRAVDPGRRR